MHNYALSLHNYTFGLCRKTFTFMHLVKKITHNCNRLQKRTRLGRRRAVENVYMENKKLRLFGEEGSHFYGNSETIISPKLLGQEGKRENG